MRRETFLDKCDERFDVEVGMIGMKFISPGYHTRMPEGEWVHATVHNFEFAVLLLPEPLAKLAPPDWNWVDFCGGRIAEILAGHTVQLSSALVEGLRGALSRAGACIFRRNVRPDYTNIDVMGGCVCAGAGDRWVDGICYQGPRMQLHPAGFGPVKLAMAMDLARDESPVARQSLPGWVAQTRSDASFVAEWDSLRVETPPLAERYLSV